MENKFGIVVIGYNRLESLKRLLSILSEADYQGYSPLLIISLDNSGDKSLEEYASMFEWTHGKKAVKTFPERLGLRKHILACGKYLEEFELDAVAVFEDDVLPSKAFFNFMRQAVEYYDDMDEVAGISLYTHLWNINAEKPFQPLYSSRDVYFMQFAQSWGQVWMRKQWRQFSDWYERNCEEFTLAEDMPTAVSKWPNSSWLKYHIRYCIETNRYFVYPYESLTTNFTDIGEHNQKGSTLFQVPLQIDSRKKYLFSELKDSDVVYDAYFENEKLAYCLEVPSDDVCIDLYGKKVLDTHKHYLLTTRIYDFQCIKSFGLLLKPHELNIIMNIPGNDIFLYDKRYSSKRSKKDDIWREQDYFYRISRWRFGIFVKLVIIKVLAKFKNKIKWKKRM